MGGLCPPIKNPYFNTTTVFRINELSEIASPDRSQQDSTA